MKLHKYQFTETGKVRLANYNYKGWTVYHYVLPPEQFMAINGANTLRDINKEAIELQIRNTEANK